MSSEILIVAALVALGFAALLYFFNKKLESLRQDEGREVLLEWLKEMRGSLDKNTETVDRRLAESTKDINDRLNQAALVIGKVQRELGQMSEIGRRMEELQDFLKNPKLRGNLGEQVLADLLSQTIPQDKFSLQHSFRDGQVVDAAITTASGIIPIDAKFPLENFRLLLQVEGEKEKEQARKAFVRDVKKHISDIAKKYVRPEEGTTDFALMYIPSEPIAYEILVHHQELSDYAWDKRVGVVSPNQFNYFLRAVLLGFERHQVQERAKEILSSLRSLRDQSAKFGEDLRIMVKHVTDAKNKAGDVELSFDRLAGKLDQVQRLESPQNPPSESPLLDE